MDKHIDHIAGIIEQLRGMGSLFGDSTAIGILAASIDVPEFTPVTAVMKTLTDKDVNREDISARLIDETRRLKSGRRSRCHAATLSC